MLNSTAHFSQVSKPKINRNVFPMRFSHKTTYDYGKLVPIIALDVVPNTNYKFNRNVVTTRMSSPQVPVMDESFQDIMFFFVPYRIIWDHSKYFFSATNADGTTGQFWYSPQVEYQIPQLVIDNPTTISGTGVNTGVQENSVLDYMSIPTKVVGASSSPNYSDESISALYTRAYCAVWNTYFRAQELQQPILIDKGDATSYLRGTSESYLTSAQYGGQLCPVAKFHDYFTSATRQPMRVANGEVPVLSEFASVSPTWVNSGGVSITSGTLSASSSGTNAGSQIAYLSNLSSMITTNISDLRNSFALENLYLRDNMYGALYKDVLYGQYDVAVNPVLLDYPEYLGGFRTEINVQQVLNTTADSGSASSPLGYTGAYSLTLNSKRNIFNYYAKEHGVLLGVVCARNANSYQQGINKRFTRRKRTDFYFPALSGLTAQAILNKEIYFQGAPSEDDLVFGYQEAWADYKYLPDVVSGAFRSNYSNGSLDYWHYADNYSSLPTLSSDWISSNPQNVDRTLQSSREFANQLISKFVFDIEMTAPFPLFDNPATLSSTAFRFPF